MNPKGIEEHLPEPYVPTAEERAGDSFVYCYDQSAVVLPVTQQKVDDGHSE